MADLGTLTGDTIEAVGTWANSNANTLTAAANAFVRDLASNLEVDYTPLAGDLPYLNGASWDYDAELARLQSVRPGYLSFSGATIDLDIDKIAALAVASAPTLSAPTAAIPTLDAERPAIDLPALPGTDVGDAPSDAPSVAEYAAPDAPSVTLPTVPTFEELQLPAVPSFTMPTFSADAPVNNLAAPTQQFSFVDAGYTSELRDPLVAKLLYDLENGGYGIDSTDELALWGRARDRAESQGRLAVETALRRGGSLNLPLPSGAVLAAVEQARAEVLRQLSEANREIALKRADMYVENRRFTIEQVQALEKMSIDLYNAIAERALNVAKVTVELGVAVFEASVRNFNAQLDAYKTFAAVFETRVRAELTKAEVYKAQLEAERLRGEFNNQRAALYQAQLNGIQTVVNLYKNRVEAIQVLTQVQAQKVDIFKSRIEAYATRVKAKEAEYGMYEAATRGELAKVDVYKADLSAYETRLRGEEMRTRVLLQGNEALLQRYNAQVAQYKAQLEGLVATATARVDRDKTYIAAQAVNVSNYKALTDAVLAGVQTKVDAQKMNNAWNIAALNSRVEAVKFRLQELQATVGLRTSVDQFGAKFYGDQVTAAMLAVNALSVKSA